MDQPQNNDQEHSEGSVEETVNTEQQIQVEVTEASNNAEETVPETVVGDTPPEQVVSEGAPAEGSMPDAPSESVYVDTQPTPTEQEQGSMAEVVAVEDAAPVAVTDELASVVNELGSMGEEVQVDEGLPSSGDSAPVDAPLQFGGSDPMDQIQADEQSAQEESSEHVPFNSGETVDESVVLDTPTAESTASSEAPVATESVPAQEPMAVAVEPTGEGAVTPNSEAVNMANQAVYEQEPARNPGDLINDVIAPSAVAAAAAEGSAGQNAITGTPEASSVESSQNMSASAKPTKQKSKKGLLVLVVVLVTLLFGGSAVAAYMLRPDVSESNSSASDKADVDSEVSTKDTDAETQAPATEVSTTPAPGENVTAKALDDYKAACGGGMVANASDYKGASPHPVVFFEQGSDSKYAMSVVAFKDKTWAADAAKITSGQLVVCVSAKVASEKKIKACPITDAATKVTTNVDYYSSTYTVDVYNAKTGAKVNSYESPSIVTECPTTAIYDKTNPKITAKYDLVSVEALIKPDVTKAL